MITAKMRSLLACGLLLAPLASSELGCIVDVPECTVDRAATAFTLDDEGMLVAAWEEPLVSTWIAAYDGEERIYEASAGQEPNFDSESDGESFHATAGIQNRSLSSPLATAALDDDGGASEGFSVVGEPRMPTGRTISVLLGLTDDEGACHSTVAKDVTF